VARHRVLRDQLVDHDDRLVDASELVECARLLVEHLIVVRIVRILGEDLVVELDRLERTLGRLLLPGSAAAGALFGQRDDLAGRALLERLVGLGGLLAAFRLRVGARAFSSAGSLAGSGAAISWIFPSPRIPYSFSSLRSARRRIASGVSDDSGASSRNLR
jgi:hypothetical protein